MSNTRQFDFQVDQPVFVRATPPGMDYLKFSGKKYKRGDHVKWKEFGLDYDTIKRFMDLRYLHHNTELEIKMEVGDGLERLDIEQLHTLVDSINEKVQRKTTTKAEFDKHKCRKSKLRDKQIGLIRSFRRNHGEFELDD